jgi:hypothetical protein
MQQYEPTSLLELPAPGQDAILDERRLVSAATRATTERTALATLTRPSPFATAVSVAEPPATEGLPLMWDEDEDEDEDDDDLLGDDDDELEFDDDEEALEEEEKEAVEGDDEEFDFDDDDEDEEEV